MDLLSPMHLAVLFIVVLLIFGPRRLPELGKGLGQTMRMFRDAQTGKEEKAETVAVAAADDVTHAAGDHPNHQI